MTAPSREIGLPVVTDAQLVALARESRADCIEVLYGAYKGRIYTFLLRLLGDPDLADDITQDVFTKAYQALGTLTKEHKVLPWLYRIANNSAIDHLRRRKRISWLRVGGLLGTREEPVSPDAPQPKRNASVRHRPDWKKVSAVEPSPFLTATDVTKTTIASGMRMKPTVRNWRLRYAAAPSWIALAISCIFGVPWSRASTSLAR